MQLTAGAKGSPEALASATSMSSSSNAELVKVIVRCRPLSEGEVQNGHQKIVSMDTGKGIVQISNPKETNILPKCFTFDSIYDENSKQIDLYYETFCELVESVLNGFNGTIFAYGQTGTGKTFTMEGVKDNVELRGVIPNAIDHIFRHIAQSTNQQYLVRASYLEIYQEEIRDLLDKNPKRKLELKEKPDVGVYVKDLTSFVTKSIDEINHVMQVGNANRSVGRTNMNEHSSRSHAIFMITIECSEMGEDGENHIRVGRLNLVDLAGSERQSKTGSEGDRFREATKINLSLSALGNVISALVDGKSTHIPYRDSKLTRLLQDSLGGNSKTVMVANIGPASYNYEETLSTLRYANRAKNITNKPHVNEDPKDALLRQFQDEISRLCTMLEKRATTGRRRRRKQRETSADGMEDSVGEDYFKEQLRRVEEERQNLTQNSAFTVEERTRLLENLQDRQKQLELEREAQSAVADKIRSMQSKLLSGSGNLLDQTREQQKLLQQKRIELSDQKRREREILRQLEEQEDNTAEIHQTFANLQQEVEVKTKKLHKLYAKLQQARLEIQDNVEAYSRERQQLEESISDMNKDLKLKWLIVENFIPVQFVEKLREQAIFDEDQGVWRLPKTNCRPKSNGSMFSDKPDFGKTMVDSGLGTGISDVSNGSDDTVKLAACKRPVSVIGLRRPMTDFEREAIAPTRPRSRSARSVYSGVRGNAAVAHHETPPFEERVYVLNNALRYSGENVITFSKLDFYPSKVADYPSLNAETDRPNTGLKNPAKKTKESVVIEVTKIPVSKSTGRETRAASTSRRISISKNVRARSAHGRAINEVLNTEHSPSIANFAGRKVQLRRGL